MVRRLAGLEVCGVRTTKDGKDVVSYTEIMERFGIGRRTAERLAAAGVLVEYKSVTKKKEFDLWASLQSYITHVQAEADKGSTKGKRQRLEFERMEVDIAWRQTKQELDEIKRDHRLGKYLDRDQVVRDYRAFFTEFQAFALTIPANVSTMLAGILPGREQREVEQEMTGMIKAVLAKFVEDHIGQGG